MTLATAAVALLLATGVGSPGDVALPVPVLAQAPERCGPAALAMVLRYYGAGPGALALADSAYQPALRGALIGDLAVAARRAGFAARVAEVDDDSLFALLREGVPPVVLFQSGIGPLVRGHYGVIVGFDSRHRAWRMNDGGPATRAQSRADFARRWKAAGSLALIVTRSSP